MGGIIREAVTTGRGQDQVGGWFQVDAIEEDKEKDVRPAFAGNDQAHPKQPRRDERIEDETVDGTSRVCQQDDHLRENGLATFARKEAHIVPVNRAWACKIMTNIFFCIRVLRIYRPRG
jgi:hypothetical protein